MGEMELGGVGNMAGCPGRAKSRPPGVKPERGLGISTEAVLPARAIAMLEVVFMKAMVMIETSERI